MRFRRNGFLPTIVAVAIAIVAFNAASYAQFNVNLSIDGATTQIAPSGELEFTAEVTWDNENPNPLGKIVFYRNDVPHKTFFGSSTSQVLLQNQLGQDTYTYRARAYDSTGAWADSSDIKITVNTPRVIRLEHPQHGNEDYTDRIKAAIADLGINGGTVFFPCIPPVGSVTIYNINDTIIIPSNITLQGESSNSAGDLGRCRIYWRDVYWNPTPTPTPSPTPNPDPCRDNPVTLHRKAMFKIVGTTLVPDVNRVRFKDLWLYFRNSGDNCWPRGDVERIEAEKAIGIHLDGSVGNISDVIFENVSITSFTNGIRATTCVTDPSDPTICTETQTTNKIHDIKIRGLTPGGNHRQLHIDAKYAYNWDVQNFNMPGMGSGQGAVEIFNSGAPPLYEGENKGLKFLQLNCNGNRGSQNPPFCVSVKKHGGLYFKQLHHEAAKQAIIVENIAPRTNDDPIIFEGGASSGQFHDASMKLYLIGNAISVVDTVQAGQDDGRSRFIGLGVNSTVVDCGDIHLDRTDTRVRANPDTTPVEWGDWRMMFTHSERNRASFFAAETLTGVSFNKTHTNCPSKVDDQPNINEVGGEHFNTGVMPTEPYTTYSHVLDQAACGSDCAQKLEDFFDMGGSVYVKSPTDPVSPLRFNRTVRIPSGSQIVGAPGAELELTAPNVPLFQIEAPVNTNETPRTSGVVIRNLKLKRGLIATGNTTGIEFINGPPRWVLVESPPGSGNWVWVLLTVGVLSDVHFSGLTIEGFTTGLANDPTSKNPMLDGVSLKNITFLNNTTAAKITSQNTSNWNIMDLTIESNSVDAVGWYQNWTGDSLQNVTCRGPMSDCIKLRMGAIYLTGLKQTQNVTHAVTIDNGVVAYGPPYDGIAPSNLIVRNSDFRGSNVRILGKSFIVSMNNRYGTFTTGSDTQGNLSRVTHCGDTYAGEPFAGLADRHDNLYFGLPTLTRVMCGKNPMPWEDAVRFGGEKDGEIPLVGNFFDNVREDFVIYQGATATEPQSKFLIKKVNDPEPFLTVNWGSINDKPLIGRFYASLRSQIVAWRSGEWWVRDPTSPNPMPDAVWLWGMPGDVPFVGNFIDEPEDEDLDEERDEIAIYRPSDGTVWIKNPRTSETRNFSTIAASDTKIQVGDFFGVGYDQIALYNNGVWNFFNPNDGSTYPAVVLGGEPHDVPVAGKYLPPHTVGAPFCTQIGVWQPKNEQFIVIDHPSSNCGNRSRSLIWGSNNEYPDTLHPNPNTEHLDDIPLTIRSEDGKLRRPTAYRRTNGAFEYSRSKGLWWVHDPFPE